MSDLCYSTIPANGYWVNLNTGEWFWSGTQKKAMAAIRCQQNTSFFKGQARLASLKGSGSCSDILSITMAGNLASWVYLSRSQHLPVTWFWGGGAYQWMATGAFTMNTSITETSILFVNNREVPSMGPRESLREGLDMAGYWLTEKKPPITIGMLIYMVGLLKVGFWRWCMWCHHTAHTIYQKFRMMHLTLCTRQCLLSKMSTDVPGPIITMGAPVLISAKRLQGNCYHYICVTATASGTEYSGKVAASNPVVNLLFTCGLG